MQTRYDYTLWEWVFSKKPTANAYDTNPYWPSYTLSSDPEEKVVSKEQSYQIIFVDEQKPTKTYRKNLTQKKWKKFPMNQQFTFEVNRIGRVTSEIKLLEQVK